jgi:hypothetical protein
LVEDVGGCFFDDVLFLMFFLNEVSQEAVKWKTKGTNHEGFKAIAALGS